MSTVSYNERSLLAEVAAGNKEAFNQLFRQHWQHIYSVAYSITQSAETAEDMVQEIFIKVWTHRASLNEVEQFDNYLFILARNHIYNELKRMARSDKFLKTLLPSTNLALDADQAVLYKESEKALKTAIEELPEQQQKVYRLCKEAGLKYEEIAGQLGISKDTVRNHMIRALRSIREKLAGYNDRALFILCMLETLHSKL